MTRAPNGLILIIAVVMASCLPQPRVDGAPSTLVSSPRSTVGSSSAGSNETPGQTLAPPPSEDVLAHYEFMVTCLAERGIAAEYDPIDGSLNIDMGLDQQDALALAIDECRDADDQPSGLLNDDYLRSYFPFLLDLYACLADEQFPIPDVITEDAFLEGRGEWHPYEVMWAEADAAQSGATGNLKAAEQLCPNDPDNPQWDPASG